MKKPIIIDSIGLFISLPPFIIIHKSTYENHHLNFRPLLDSQTHYTSWFIRNHQINLWQGRPYIGLEARINQSGLHPCWPFLVPSPSCSFLLAHFSLVQLEMLIAGWLQLYLLAKQRRIRCEALQPRGWAHESWTDEEVGSGPALGNQNRNMIPFDYF